MNHRQSPVWQKAMRLAEAACLEASRMRPSERFSLGSQIVRAATSVASNIAEGWSRDSPKDKARFLSIAQGSLDELHTQLLICRRLGWMPTERVSPMVEQYDEVGRMLTALRRYLRRCSARPSRN